MNDYQITSRDPNGEVNTSIITERRESTARSAFKASFRGTGRPAPDIIEVELIREGTLATKQQERETLAAIKKMVEELGPQSYLATAFEGCFEDAERNIENDFGDSMKARWLHADAQLNAANGTIEELETHKRLMKETIDRLQQEKEEAEARQISVTDLAHLVRLAEKDLTEAEQRRDEAAQKIVAYADAPTSEVFRQAVADHRNVQATVEAKKERLERLYTIKNAT